MSMKLEQLDVLEKKIGQVVGLIGHLQQQNTELRNDLNQSRLQSQTNELMIQQLQEENKELAVVQNETAVEKEKEEQIRIRIEQMLAKLDELEHLAG